MGAYGQDRYFTDSRDKKGHSSSFRVCVPTGIMQDLAELVASRQIPHLRTTQDCMRDALGRWLEWMVKENGIESLNRTDSTFKMMDTLDRHADLQARNEKIVISISAAARNAKSPDEKAYVKSLAELAFKQLTDPYYRSQVDAYR